MLNEDTFGEEAMNETQLDALNDDTFGEEAMNETQLDALNDDTFGEAAQAEMREDALNDLTFHAVTLRSPSLSWLPLASRESQLVISSKENGTHSAHGRALVLR